MLKQSFGVPKQVDNNGIFTVIFCNSIDCLIVDVIFGILLNVFKGIIN
jgi:hypothetical protein